MATSPPYIPAVLHNGKKTLTVLENNPTVMTPLAHILGLSPSLTFHDIYSFSPSELTHILRPAHALLVILPLTPTWAASRTTEDASAPLYNNSGESEPVFWVQQTIGHACGSIGLLHCALNGTAANHILPGSTLARLQTEMKPLARDARAAYLYNDVEFERAHQSVAGLGDTVPPGPDEGDRLGQHFVAFVKGQDGRLWELEGGRRGPICRGVLGEGEDVLSERAVELGVGRVIRMELEAGGGDLRFSALALA